VANTVTLPQRQCGAPSIARQKAETMKIPAHVPNAVRRFIQLRMEGAPPDVDDSKNPYLQAKLLSRNRGLTASVATTREALAELDSQILAASREKVLTALADLKEHREFLIAGQEHVTEEIAILERFATDLRMADVFSRLTRVFVDDDGKWQAFFGSALIARMNFSAQRTNLKEAQILKSKIENTAAELARLLAEFLDLGVDGPDEFYNPTNLVYRDSFAVIEELERQRLDLLNKNGLSEIELTPESIELFGQEKPENDRSLPDNLLDILVKSGEFKQMQDLQRPSTLEIMEDIASSARLYTPTLYGVSAAATQSQKANDKTQYIRALWYLLNKSLNDRRVERAPDLLHAIAGITSVVLNGVNDDATYDDVRKTLEDRSRVTSKNVPSQRKIRRSKKR
jgi:hypothetical protein